MLFSYGVFQTSTKVRLESHDLEQTLYFQCHRIDSAGSNYGKGLSHCIGGGAPQL